MAGKLFSLLTCCLILLVLPTGVLAHARDVVPGLLTLSVFNDAFVPPAVLAEAESQAGRILSRAGIQVQWLSCETGGSHVPDQFEKPSPCSSITYPSHLSVRIVLTGPSVRDDIFGEAYTSSEGKGAYIKLYYAHLAKANAHAVLGAGQLLGCLIAHELGHLLLGANSHGHAGIMQSRWEQTQLRDAGRGNLQFTPPQAAAMRECLAEAGKGEVHRRFVND